MRRISVFCNTGDISLIKYHFSGKGDISPFHTDVSKIRILFFHAFIGEKNILAGFKPSFHRFFRPFPTGYPFQNLIGFYRGHNRTP